MFNYQDLETLILPKLERFSQQYQHFILSCSGGLDSTALFHVFLGFSKLKKNFSFSVFHMNFGLRGEESEGDQAFLESLTSRHKISFHCQKIPKNEALTHPGESTQEWARRLRREAWQKITPKNHLVVLGHHYDDQVETTLFRLIRGGNPAHFLGMKELSGNLWRPFLDVKRETLEAYQIAKNFNFRLDSSNLEDDYTRNFLRHKLIPEMESLFPGVKERLLNLAKDTRDLSDFALGHLPEGLLLGPGKLSRSKLASLSDGVAFAVLSQQLKICLGQKSHASREFLGQIVHHIRFGEHRLWSRQLMDGGKISVEHDRISIEKAKPSAKGERFAQYQSSLQHHEIAGFIEENGEVICRLATAKFQPAQSDEFLVISPEPGTSSSFFLETPKSNDIFISSLGKKRYRMRDLFTHWETSFIDRAAWLFVKLRKSYQPLALFNGKATVVPDGNKAKIACCAIDVRKGY